MWTRLRVRYCGVRLTISESGSVIERPGWILSSSGGPVHVRRSMRLVRLRSLSLIAPPPSSSSEEGGKCAWGAAGGSDKASTPPSVELISWSAGGAVSVVGAAVVVVVDGAVEAEIWRT